MKTDPDRLFGKRTIKIPFGFAKTANTVPVLVVLCGNHCRVWVCNVSVGSRLTLLESRGFGREQCSSYGRNVVAQGLIREADLRTDRASGASEGRMNPGVSDGVVIHTNSW